MIPKKIHYFWFGGNEMSSLSKRCIVSWKEKLPDYQIIIWNEDNLPKTAVLAWLFLKEKKYAFASDYARYYILNQEGGIYFDTDIEVVKSLDNLLSYKCFLGYESKDRLNSAVLGAEKNNAFIRTCLKLMEDNYANNEPYLIAPELANKAAKLIGENEFFAFKEDYFYPYNPYDKLNQKYQLMYSDITNNTYTIHHWEKKWKMSVFSKIRRLAARYFK